MATANPFDILGDNDNDDPSQLIAAQEQKVVSKKQTPVSAPAGKLPSKPAPPAQAVRDVRTSTLPARGGGIGGGRGGPGRGRGRGSFPGQTREFGNGNENGFTGGYGGSTGAGGEDGDTGKPLDRERGNYGGPRQPYRGGGRRGGYGYRNGEAGEDSERPPRRLYERRSGTGRGNEIKREGSGRGNWGTASDDVFGQENEEIANPEDKPFKTEKQSEGEDLTAPEANKEDKEGAPNENEEKEPEDKEMTLEEYEKIREEKRKALLALKSEERKVEVDKELQSMLQLSHKKENDEIFVKLGSDKDSKRKDGDRDDRVKKAVSINEFLKPAEGERFYSPRGGRGRGRGRGRGEGGGTFRGGFGGNSDFRSGFAAPAIDDPGHFPTLGGKQ